MSWADVFPLIKFWNVGSSWGDTGERTVMSYLVKPLHDQIMKAFHER